MRIHFGLASQDGVLPAPRQTEVGVAYFGPRQLLAWLEEQLGLVLPSQDVDHLRIEQYRQALKHYLGQQADAFFAASFIADDLGTASALLSRRDELLQAGWDFEATVNTPPRLQVLATVESYWGQVDLSFRLYAGETDRLVNILAQAKRIPAFLTTLQLCDPVHFFPPIWQRIFSACQIAGLKILDPPELPALRMDSDLSRWQAFLRKETSDKPKLEGDGSLLVLRAFRETHLAAFVAKLLQQNLTLQPAILLPKGDRTLDNALVLEGLPSLGVPSASLARPSLQVLKLAPVFLWDPIDPYKIMEFVSLAIKPLEDGLAQRIAAFLANTPGLFSNRWKGMVEGYLDGELVERLKRNNKTTVEQVRKEYHFWFSRKRADSRTGKVSKQDVKSMYAYLQQWAADLNKEEEMPTLLVLSAQARKIVELLDALPEEELSYLELERIVRTIYEPAPLQVRSAQAGHLPIAHQPAAITGSVEELLWWDFFARDPDYFFSRWYPDELRFFKTQNLRIEGPNEQNERLVAQRKRPVLWVQNRLLLCQPDYCDGTPVQAHPLLGDLEAAFGDELDAITIQVDEQKMGTAWLQGFQLPNMETEAAKALARPKPFLDVKTDLLPREEETPTSLEQLLYYPYQWVLRHHIQLRQSSILGVVQDNRLLGNLAHRLLEILLEKEWKKWTKTELENWVAQEIPSLLEKEGATLLLYGREPERIAFIKHMKYAAWSLVTLLRQNNWEVLGTEEELSGDIDALRLKGRADLVLRRGDERAIVDLKWRGIGRYTNVLSSEEDIQLALYARLLPPAEQWAHTAYYIIDKGRMLVRNTKAFKEAQAVQQEEVAHEDIYEQMLERVLSTYQWRQKQLANGQVEIRCEATSGVLEDHYGEELLKVLEMKTTNAYFDDYDVLIGLVS